MVNWMGRCANFPVRRARDVYDRDHRESDKYNAVLVISEFDIKVTIPASNLPFLSFALVVH